MGGRGSSSGGGGGGGGVGLLGALGAFNAAGGSAFNNVQSSQYGSALNLQQFQTVGDYTDGNNPELLKWQGQTDDKAANYLAKVDKTTDLAQFQQQTNDPWGFYDNPMQKMTVQMGLNKPATVLSESDFNNYVQQTGATVLYRGWSGDNAVDRFKNSPNSHVGNGINGDGYYFSADRNTAMGYGGVGTKAALSPNARVVSLDAVNAEIAKTSPKFNKALSYAGSKGTRTYGTNEGQAQMALKMGYNTIDAGWAVIPLTRDAVVISNKKNWG